MTTIDDAQPPTRMNWGDEIRKIRESQGLSQRRLAKLADVDRASLLRFESGASRGNLDMVEKLVEVLGYEFDLIKTEFPGGFMTPPPPDPVAG
jgi:transcriptional regulator with XRE-family HTH domain